MPDTPKPGQTIAEAANDDGNGHHKKLVTARVTFLEMANLPSKPVHPPSRPRIALLTAENITAAYFRFLYQQVGKPHHWYGRRYMDDIELDNTINSDTTEIHILYADGCPAGFFELDTSRLPEAVEIVYFGLIGDYQGLALGKWFLHSAINAGWAHEPEKLVLQTNSLDHPAALPLYQKLGFSPVGFTEETIEIWE